MADWRAAASTGRELLVSLDEAAEANQVWGGRLSLDALRQLQLATQDAATRITGLAGCGPSP